MSTNYSDNIKVGAALPLDGKTYVKTLAELQDLGVSDYKTYSYYEDMPVWCLENHTQYRWKEVAVDDIEPLLDSNFTYGAWIVDDIDYTGKEFNFFEVKYGMQPTTPFQVNLPPGMTLGGYETGDTVPSFNNVQEMLESLGRVADPYIYQEPSHTFSVTNIGTREVGETITNLTAQFNYIQNDAGSMNYYAIFYKGEEHNASGIGGHSVTLTTSNQNFDLVINYDAGTVIRQDSLGNDQIPNTISAGTINDSIGLRGYYKIFYGPSSDSSLDASSTRSLPNSRFETESNTFTLNTGKTENIFYLWLPTGKSLSAVSDLDALNANLTASYVSSSLSVNDAGGNLVSGTLYTYTQAAPYASNHRHQITIS